MKQKKKIMTVNDLEGSVQLSTVKVKYQDGIYHIVSGWNSGKGKVNLWLVKEEEYKNRNHRLYPVFHPDALNLRVIEYEGKKA